jgi:ribose transport system ATP-binding protein
MDQILEMKGITKYIFDSNGKALKNTTVKILDEIDFSLTRGEVHVLLGENGAGKSTLMKVLGGIIPPDDGSIVLNGKKVSFKNTREARDHGIGFIHQELNLCSNLDVAHNIYLGREPKKKGMVDDALLYQQCESLLQSLGFDISPRTVLGELSTAQQQIVEISKALSYESKILIMDEPTASLTRKEIDLLFGLIKKLKEKDVTIIYISHRFDEIEEIGDTITVLRDGKYVGSLSVANFQYDEVIRMMVGRTLGNMYTCTHEVQDEIILEVNQLKLSPKTDEINIYLKKGEILGIGGLVGAGRTELAKSIFGARSFAAGQVVFCGEQVANRTVPQLIDKGMAYLSEDRKSEGLVTSMSIAENISLASLYKLFPTTRLDKSKENEVAEKVVNQLNINSKSIFQLVKTLSGGNQQRVALGKWLVSSPKLLILDEPTRGIDVNAKAEIYKIIDEIASQGVAVMLISSELPELIGMSDRMYIMRDGTTVAEIKDKAEMTQENIVSYTLVSQLKEVSAM